MERWQISPALNLAVSRLGAQDPSFAAHGRAERLVDALATLFGVPAQIHWARRDAKGGLQVSSGLAGFMHEAAPGQLVIRIDVGDIVQTAAHEYAHELVRAGRLRRVTRPTKAELGDTCDATAALFGDDARRLGALGFGPEAIAVGLYTRWAA